MVPGCIHHVAFRWSFGAQDRPQRRVGVHSRTGYKRLPVKPAPRTQPRRGAFRQTTAEARKLEHDHPPTQRQKGGWNRSKGNPISTLPLFGSYSVQSVTGPDAGPVAIDARELLRLWSSSWIAKHDKAG